MSELDVSRWLAPIAAAEPSGPNLEYDPAFGEFERSTQAKPERVMGDKVLPAEEPSWRDVAENAAALLAKTRDLRVAVPLTSAWVRLHGVPGLAAGLTLVHGLLETFWDTVHPQLDPEDDNDPTLRVNSIAGLADPAGVLKHLREAPFVQSPALGRFALRDLRIATGALTAPAGTDPPTLGQIEGACMDTPLEQLQAIAGGVTAASGQLAAIDSLLGQRVAGQAPDLKPLKTDLADLQKYLAGEINKRAPGDPAAATGDGAAAAPAAAGRPRGPIGSREDVVRALEEICRYYAQQEPASPIPLLLRRAQGLVGKDFMQIIRDLTPGAVAQAQVFEGAVAGAENPGAT